MRGFWKSMLVGITLAVLFGMPGLVKCSYAETDVTDKVEIIKSRMMFDRSTSQNYLDVSVKNISEDVLLTPIKVVVDSISSTDVTVVNADGVTDDGAPYKIIEINELSDGQLDIGETTTKRVIFNNLLRMRFAFTLKIMALLPTIESTVLRVVNSLENNDTTGALINFGSYSQEKMETSLNSKSKEALSVLSESIKNAVLLESTDKKAKFESTVVLPGGFDQKFTFYMYFKNGVWRFGPM